MPAQAAAGAVYISFMIMAPSGTGSGVVGGVPPARPVGFQPSVHFGRIPHEHRLVCPVIFSRPRPALIGSDPWPGIAHALVDFPTLLQPAVTVQSEVFVERGLVVVERQ